MSLVSIELLTIPEAAALLRVSTARAYDLVRRGLVPAARLGRHIRIDARRLQEFVDAGGRGLEGGWRGRPTPPASPREVTTGTRA
jgi:excisionase family DNA binding protein